MIDGDVAEAIAELKQDVDGVHPRQRQRPARADADGARTRRRVPAEDLPYDPRRAGKRFFGETSDAAALRLVDAKPAGESFIFMYEPSAKDAGNA